MKNFNDIYEQISKQYAVSMEGKRKEILKEKIIVLVVVAIIGLWILYYYETFLFVKIYIWFIIIYLSVSIYSMMSKKNENYNQFFKDNVIKAFVKEYSETLEYKPEEGLAQDIYCKGHFERYDIYYSEDLIQGMLEDRYKVAMAEVVTAVKSADKEENCCTFSGLVVAIKFDKLVNANIKIRKDKIKILDENTRIEMDFRKFEEKFDVYATDKIMAMQILTADVMLMILDFQEKTRLKPELTLTENWLMIRFETEDLFEAKTHKDSLDYKTLKKYYDTINFTLDIAKNFVKNIEQTEI